MCGTFGCLPTGSDVRRELQPPSILTKGLSQHLLDGRIGCCISHPWPWNESEKRLDGSVPLYQTPSAISHQPRGSIDIQQHGQRQCQRDILVSDLISVNLLRPYSSVFGYLVHLGFLQLSLVRWPITIPHTTTNGSTIVHSLGVTLLSASAFTVSMDLAMIHELPIRSGQHPSRISIDALLNPQDERSQQEHSHGSQYYRSPISFHYPTPSVIFSEYAGSIEPPRSVHSSPGRYRHERYDSVSSSTSNVSKRRPPRPRYVEEEMYFIWYHRVDLSQTWKEVRHSFNRQFPNRQRHGFQGMQCKLYRFIKEKRCPTLREQKQMRDGEVLSGLLPRFGIREWLPGIWYPWMGTEQSHKDSILGAFSWAIFFFFSMLEA